MPKINNTAVIQKLVDELKLYPGADVIPTELTEKILPVYQINADAVAEVTSKTANIVRGNFGISTTAIIYSVSATGKFYLTGCSIGARANTAATANGVSSIQVVIGGVTQDILYCAYRADTAGHGESMNSLNMSHPVLVDAGTDILVSAAPTNTRAYGSIVGYTEED